ncbi:uncharacterized protein LOC117317870 [Pecten maximus]|uniref:uncharacterized protein LOC117317870 n=1 Tax=Pecten maximus TaxID=6579 RepID=UPI0014590AE2|nr:uncharacterized protein LOC117317870 [Pecten maximus]
MFFYNCKLFGMRGHDEHHALECDQFIIGEDSKGKYFEFVGRASKTFKGGLAQREIDIKNIRHYSNQGERFIVDLYELEVPAGPSLWEILQAWITWHTSEVWEPTGRSL